MSEKQEGLARLEGIVNDLEDSADGLEEEIAVLKKVIASITGTVVDIPTPTPITNTETPARVYSAYERLNLLSGVLQEFEETLLLIRGSI
jgi:hypothetical protein